MIPRLCHYTYKVRGAVISWIRLCYHKYVIVGYKLLNYASAILAADDLG